MSLTDYTQVGKSPVASVGAMALVKQTSSLLEIPRLWGGDMVRGISYYYFRSRESPYDQFLKAAGRAEVCLHCAEEGPKSPERENRITCNEPK